MNGGRPVGQGGPLLSCLHADLSTGIREYFDARRLPGREAIRSTRSTRLGALSIRPVNPVNPVLKGYVTGFPGRSVKAWPTVMRMVSCEKGIGGMAEQSEVPELCVTFGTWTQGRIPVISLSHILLRRGFPHRRPAFHCATPFLRVPLPAPDFPLALTTSLPHNLRKLAAPVLDQRRGR